MTNHLRIQLATLCKVSLSTVALSTLLSVSVTGHSSTELEVTIRPDYRPAPGEDPGELGPNEFTAGSVLSLNCDVQRNSSSVTYSWSVTGNPDTPGCTACDIPSSSTSTLRLAQAALTSYFAGDYTCTVSESGRPASGTSNTFTVRVVGMFGSILAVSILHPGGGVYVTRGAPGFASRAIANNGLIVSASIGLILDCVSSQSEEGVITGRDGNTIDLGVSGVWRLTNPFNGVLRLYTFRLSSINAPDQGIYTCTVSDSRGGQVVINVGLYPSGFNGEVYCVCMCTRVCVFDGEMYSVSVCICPHVCMTLYMYTCVSACV